ncbi:MAG TPA: glycoside hydrolase family 127 protein [Opitutaceae bacterium]|nr:glycoside hydrolase family 127 protein [Opitutaceae bacterium]
MNYPSALPLSHVRLTRGFLAERARLVRDVVIPYQWEALNDRVAGAEPSGCVHNFQVAAGEKPGKFYGLFWQDSDLAKWIEAASYRLATHPDAALEAELDRLIATLAKAQGADGYLNTYFQLVEPQNRWANLRDCHELYVAGHMIEAGVAHFRATGKRTLLTVVSRLADLIERTFGLGPGQIPGYCGHEEIELALVKLARATGEARYARLAAYFIDQRGREPNYLMEETRRRGEEKLPWHMYFDGLATLQAARPVRELTEPVGHAVRQMYLLAAMADLARDLGDDSLRRSCDTLWASIVQRHLYLTGGVGSEPYGEKFTDPFDLPPDRAYAETCAAIGVIFFARRMLELGLRGEYADVMERALYNNVLSGMSLDGTKFFYVNPLELIPSVAKRRYECHLVKTQRVGWFGCACCPPNLARLFASLGEYLASQQPDGLALHLYAEGELRFTAAGRDVRLAVRTDYPWTETVAIEVRPAQPAEFTLRLRIPGWCRGATVAVNGQRTSLAVQDGYVALRRTWTAGDKVELTFPMPIERVYADPRVAPVAGRVALQRGPVVYCLEEPDHGDNLAAVALPRDAALTARTDPGLLGGCVVIEGQGQRTQRSAQLYQASTPATVPQALRAIPYALWANRGEGEMRVWINES